LDGAGGAAKAEPERATQASIHAAAIASGARRRKVAFEDARFIVRRSWKISNTP
jgi:hypothetical protein